MHLCQLHIHVTNLTFYHIPKTFCWIQTSWLRRPMTFTELIVLFMRPIWINICLQTWCVIILEIAIKRCLTLSIQGCTWSATVFIQAIAFKPWLIGIKWTKVRRKHSPQYYPNTTSLDYWRKAGWVNGFLLLMPILSLPSAASAEIQIHQARLSFSSLQPSTSGEPVPTAASDLCSSLTGTETYGLLLL